MFDSGQALRFVNTRLDRPTGLVDELADPAAASRWLAAELGYGAGRALPAGDHASLLAFRDSARRLVQARSAGTVPSAGVLAAVNEAALAAPMATQLSACWQASVQFAATGSEAPAELAQLTAGLASAVIRLVTDPPGELAECAADDCVVLFARTDPRRRWHSDRCGNRMRAARSYARHRTASPRAR